MKSKLLTNKAENEILVRHLEAEDPFVWTLQKIKLPRNVPWSFQENRWQIDILKDQHPQIRVKKSVQRGLTTIFLCKILHYLNYHSASAMYTLPRQDDLTTFTQSQLNPILQSSPHIQSLMKDTNSVRMKHFVADIERNGVKEKVDSYFHLTEASVEPRNIPVDLLVQDEIDRSDQIYLEIFKGRMEASKNPMRYMFSTPTLPGVGIDKQYENTTQCEWFVRCPSCNEAQFLLWEKHFVELPKPHYECWRCHKTIGVEAILNGEWIPLYPEREIQGYHVTHMMCPISKPPHVLFADMQDSNYGIKNFYNLQLGQAYSTAMGSLPRELMRMRMFDSPHEKETMPLTSQQYFLGVDQGEDVHFVLARRDGNVMRVVLAAKIPRKKDMDWYDIIIQLIQDFHVRFCVVDYGPNTHDARKIVDAFKGQYRVAMCQYSEISEPLREDREEGKVHVNRTEQFDSLQREISDGRWKLWGNWEAHDVPMRIVQHLANLRRDEKADHQGIIKAFWIAAGQDHFAHAMLYCKIAVKLAGGSGFAISTLDTGENMGVVVPEKQTGLWKVWQIVPESEEDAPGDHEIKTDRIIA